MDSKIESTKQFLLSKGIGIDTRNNWLQNCVQWFVEENSNSNINELHTFVYDQFLLADLRDIQLDCLPANVLDQEKLMLTGKYTLQIDSMQDVSQSCYSQIQIIRGTGKNVNVENQDARSRNHADTDYNLKPNHMLKLNMTDGVQHVFGMEYEMLPSIRGGFIPGCKIVLSGPIEVRRGVFFLKAINFHLLGGELDSIIVQNSVENVLARILNLDENPNAGPVNIFHDLTNNLSTQIQPTPLPSQPNNIVNNLTSNQSHEASNSRSSNSYQNTIGSSANQPSSRNGVSNSTTNHTNNYNSSAPGNDLDEWEDDDLMDMHVWNDIDLVNLPSQPPQPPPSSSTPSSITCASSSNTSSQNLHSYNSTSSNKPNSLPNPNLRSSNSIQASNSQTHPSSSSSNSCTNNFPSVSLNPPASAITTASNHSHTLQNNINLNPNNLNSFIAPNGSTSNSSNLKRYPSPDLTPPAKRLNSSSTPNHDFSPHLSMPTSSRMSPPLQSHTSSEAPPAPPSQPIRSASSRHEISPPAAPPTRMSLARIKASPPPCPFSMVFRGCKVKSLEKLSVSKGTWRLPATITDDGIEFLSVDFSDAVIFNISGVSAAELQSKKKQVTTDPELRKSIEEMVQNIRTQILNYEGSMKISFTASQKPTVVSLPK